VLRAGRANVEVVVELEAVATLTSAKADRAQNTSRNRVVSSLFIVSQLFFTPL
jgi:hypothetical protein